MFLQVLLIMKTFEGDESVQLIPLTFSNIRIYVFTQFIFGFCELSRKNIESIVICSWFGSYLGNLNCREKKNSFFFSCTLLSLWFLRSFRLSFCLFLQKLVRNLLKMSQNPNNHNLYNYDNTSKSSQSSRFTPPQQQQQPSYPPQYSSCNETSPDFGNYYNISAPRNYNDIQRETSNERPPYYHQQQRNMSSNTRGYISSTQLQPRKMYSKQHYQQIHLRNNQYSEPRYSTRESRYETKKNHIFFRIFVTQRYKL